MSEHFIPREDWNLQQNLLVKTVAERDRYREALERIAAAGDHRSLTIRSTAYMANLARDALSEDVETGKR